MEETEIKLKFGAQLSRLRKLRGLSLEDLEGLSGVSSSSLSAYERGEGNPTLQTLSLLSSSLHVPIYRLLDEQPASQQPITAALFWMEGASELLDFYRGPGGPEELSRCLARCTGLLEAAFQCLAQPKDGGEQKIP